MFAVAPAAPGRTHMLLRGNATMPGEVVSADALAAVGSRLPATGVSADADDGRRRLALAGWVADARNPLFARVIVNRLWHHHFGVGLVDTPSDFGFNGGRPSHPELLDWLASELIDSGWSLKHVHRLIVTSAAYRQASAVRPEALRARRRQSAAVACDAASVGGRGDARRHARGQRPTRRERSVAQPYLDFKTYFFKGTQFYDPLEQTGDGFTRRSLYRIWARGGRSPLLDVLDCPDPSAAAPRRAVTSTPLQALALFNNAFVFDQADKVAQRLRSAGNARRRRGSPIAWRWGVSRRRMRPRSWCRSCAGTGRRRWRAFCLILPSSWSSSDGVVEGRIVYPSARDCYA